MQLRISQCFAILTLLIFQLTHLQIKNKLCSMYLNKIFFKNLDFKLEIKAEILTGCISSSVSKSLGQNYSVV